MGTLAITNLASTPTPLGDLHSRALAVGETLSIERAASDLPRMASIIAALAAGTISVTFTPTAAEIASGLLAPPQSVQGADVAPVAATDVFGGPLIVVRKALTSGGSTGTLDDVTLAAVDTLPYKFRVVGAIMYLSTPQAATTATLRSRAAGAGTALATFDTSIGVGLPTNTATVVIAPAALEGLFLRRDRAIVGEVILFLRRES